MVFFFTFIAPEIAFLSTLLYVKDSKDKLLCNKGLPRGCLQPPTGREGTYSSAIDLVLDWGPVSWNFPRWA